MKNIVFIPNINLGNDRNKSYGYSVESWRRWCDKNNVVFVTNAKNKKKKGCLENP